MTYELQLCMKTFELEASACCSQEDVEPQIHESLSIDNTLWASAVVASGEEEEG